jgi:hypothetical protein
MTLEIPQYCMKAYALLFYRHKTTDEFGQSDLDWLVSSSMRKKIFSLLLRAGWVRKKSKSTYQCEDPTRIFLRLLDFRVPEMIKSSEKEYALTGLSAIEIWSDYSYTQRGKEKSPYFIKVLKKDLGYWKSLFNRHGVPNYIKEGTNIGEYAILIPVDKIDCVEKDGFKVEKLRETLRIAKSNRMYEYPYNYMRSKYGEV